MIVDHVIFRDAFSSHHHHHQQQQTTNKRSLDKPIMKNESSSSSECKKISHIQFNKVKSSWWTTSTHVTIINDNVKCFFLHKSSHLIFSIFIIIIRIEEYHHQDQNLVPVSMVFQFVCLFAIEKIQFKIFNIESWMFFLFSNLKNLSRRRKNLYKIRQQHCWQQQLKNHWKEKLRFLRMMCV